MTVRRDIPYRFQPTATAAQLHADFGGLEAGEESGSEATVAGRLMLRRVQGKLCFGTLDDASGRRIQLFAPAKTTPDFEEFCALSIGDWIGATGEVMKTRRGELSVRVDDWRLLAAARRPFPDKWHGLADTDTRYRRRYVDLWVTPAARRAFEMRSAMVAAIRAALAERGYVEVETPVLHPIAGGAAARPFVTHHNSLACDFFLRVAPELYLKRLIVGGMQRVFEIGRVFRNEGLSPRHSPEFTMLELYAAHADYTDMMALTEQVVATAAIAVTGGTTVTVGDATIDLAPPWRRATMAELVAEVTGQDLWPTSAPGDPSDPGRAAEKGDTADAGNPHRSADPDDPGDPARAFDSGHPGDPDGPCDLSGPNSLAHAAKLRAAAARLDVATESGWSAGRILAEIYERRVEGNLLGPIFVCDFPVEVSPLARAHRSSPGLVERFEAVVAGRELANAFTELADPDEQRRRFAEQERNRRAGDAEAMSTDDDYLRALEYGLPPTGGLGIGIDRLAMLLSGAETIRDVVLFPTLRPEQPTAPPVGR